MSHSRCHLRHRVSRPTACAACWARAHSLPAHGPVTAPTPARPSNTHRGWTGQPLTPDLRHAPTRVWGDWKDSGPWLWQTHCQMMWTRMPCYGCLRSLGPVPYVGATACDPCKKPCLLRMRLKAVGQASPAPRVDACTAKPSAAAKLAQFLQKRWPSMMAFGRSTRLFARNSACPINHCLKPCAAGSSGDRASCPAR